MHQQNVGNKGLGQDHHHDDGLHRRVHMPSGLERLQMLGVGAWAAYVFGLSPSS